MVQEVQNKIETTSSGYPAEMIEIVHAVKDSSVSSIMTIVMGLMSLIDDPNSNTKDFVDLIKIDPPLAAKILAVANSAYFSPTHKIEAIERAIMWIGYEKLQDIALQQKVKQLFGVNLEIEGYRISDIWLYSASIALLAKRIFREELRKPGDIVYSAGLLHKFGLIVQIQELGQKFQRLLEESVQRKLPISDIEQEYLGYDHIELGAALMEAWSLEGNLSTAIRFQNRPFNAPDDCIEISTVLYVASSICYRANVGYGLGFTPDAGLYKRCIDTLKIDEVALEMIWEEASVEIEKLVEMGIF